MLPGVDTSRAECCHLSEKVRKFSRYLRASEQAHSVLGAHRPPQRAHQASRGGRLGSNRQDAAGFFCRSDQNLTHVDERTDRLRASAIWDGAWRQPSAAPPPPKQVHSKPRFSVLLYDSPVPPAPPANNGSYICMSPSVCAFYARRIHVPHNGS